jgi:hypothetical protein
MERWRRSLDLALDVLALVERAPGGTSGRQLTAEVRLPTDVMWQSVLQHALDLAAAAGQIVVHSVADVPPAWIPTGQAPGGDNAVPDYLVSSPSLVQLWCLDAKYKVLDLDKAPSSEDRYQAFAYTHLARVGAGLREVTNAGLLYAWPPTAPLPPNAPEYRRGGATPSIPLTILRIPFPAPSEAMDESAWRTYMQRTADTLNLVLTG